MTELKTLKDLKNDDWKESYNFEWVDADELKQEAVKRWKYFKKKYMEELDEKKRIHYWGRMEEIKEFNNLTDEDLK